MVANASELELGDVPEALIAALARPFCQPIFGIGDLGETDAPALVVMLNVNIFLSKQYQLPLLKFEGLKECLPQTHRFGPSNF